MSRTIKTAVVGPVSLSLPSDNPLTITKAGIITSASDGIDGDDSTAWNITNSGLVTASLWGINLAGGGSVTNEKGGVIAGLDGISDQGFDAEPTGVSPTVTNAGIISGTQIGIEISGTVTNLSGGVINGGILSGFGRLAVTNAGTIIGGVHGQGVIITNEKSGTIIGGISGGGGNGVVVVNSGLIEGDSSVLNSFDSAIRIQGDSVTNQKSGIIIGFNGIISDWTDQNNVINAGIIKGDSTAGNGIAIPQGSGGGNINNTGTVSGDVGIYFGGAATMITVNSGVIAGNASSGDGIQIDGNPRGISFAITNQKGGSITGQDGISTVRPLVVNNQGDIGGSVYGVLIMEGGTVTNAGTISGLVDSVMFEGTISNSLLVIDPGAVFNGTVDASAGTNGEIELAKGTGTINGIGNDNFIGFYTLQVDTGGQWKLNGANTITYLENDGSLIISGSLYVGTLFPSAGTFSLSNGSTLEIAEAYQTSTKMSFAKKSELVADNYASFGGSLLTNFGGDGTVDLKDFGFANISSSTLKSGSLTLLQVMNGTQQATLDFQSSGLGKGNFQFASDQSGGVLITHA